MTARRRALTAAAFVVPVAFLGTFFADSIRAEGAQDETWWVELMEHIDKNYRTRGEIEVDWTD